MSSKKVDPIAEALDTATASRRATKLEELYSDRPEVLTSIVNARRERKLSYRQIAIILCKDPHVNVSEGAVQNFLSKRGIE